MDNYCAEVITWWRSSEVLMILSRDSLSYPNCVGRALANALFEFAAMAPGTVVRSNNLLFTTYRFPQPVARSPRYLLMPT
ncbi:MAG: hypothetical protein V4443_00375 [Pseudomonadota bacterium]